MLCSFRTQMGYTLDPGVSQHLQELLLRERRDAHGLRLGQFAAGVFTNDQIVRLFADRAGGRAPRLSSFIWIPSRV